MHTYIKQGRFGEFVDKVLELEEKRRIEEREKDEEWKLWIVYVHSMAEESFDDWKAKIFKQTAGISSKGTGSDADMTEEDIKEIMDNLFHE